MTESTSTRPASRKRGGLLARAIAEASAEIEASGHSKTAVIYLRVSSRDQVNTDFDSEGFSLPAQRTACARRAEALGADVVAEFVEAGESGTSRRGRKALAEMLHRVAEGDVDYVIVHKIDRLARRRLDDATITEEIRKFGSKLVSVSENIDESPSGTLTHGILAAIGEYYSANLAQETLKGTTEKARRGGTPGKAPIGYLNVRVMHEGREVRTVRPDPDRFHLVQHLFRLYATGSYALSDLVPIMEALGLTSRQTAKRPSVPLGKNDLQMILRNDYYIGVVRYRGIVAEGRHDPLIDEGTFQAVQDLLTSRRQAADRNWRNHHYLIGSLVCAECGSRLMLNRITGGNGTKYDYFVYARKSMKLCSQPHHRAERIERSIERKSS